MADARHKLHARASLTGHIHATVMVGGLLEETVEVELECVEEILE